MLKQVAGVVLSLAGILTVYRALFGKEFYLGSIGGTRGPRLSEWLGKPLMLLIGIAALVLGVTLWKT